MYPDRAKRKSLYDAALAVCDELDGVKGGLLSNVLESTIDFGRSLGSGEFEAPGYNVWGIDFGLPGTSGLQTIINALGLNNAQPKNPMPDDAPSFSIFWDQWVRFAITRDPNFDSLTFHKGTRHETEFYER